jgi:hypothetical protein
MAKPKSGGRARRPAGISNRPIEEELRSQAELPPPGTRKGETDPALPPRPGVHPPPRDPAPKQRRAKHPPPDEPESPDVERARRYRHPGEEGDR